HPRKTTGLPEGSTMRVPSACSGGGAAKTDVAVTSDMIAIAEVTKRIGQKVLRRHSPRLCPFPAKGFHFATRAGYDAARPVQGCGSNKMPPRPFNRDFKPRRIGLAIDVVGAYG